MVMYAVSTIPLIAKLLHQNIKQIWYADDASAGVIYIHSIHTWCNNLIQHCPGTSKSWFIVKEAKLSEAFTGSSISITTN